VTGLVVTHVAFLLALLGLHRIATRHVSAEAAALSVWAMALFPAAFVFSKPYPCSIFLACSVWAFLCVEDRRDFEAALLTIIAALARPNGLALALALVLAVRSRRRALLVAGPALAAVACWSLVLLSWTGDPLAFVHSKAAWPEVTLVDLFQGALSRPDVAAHALLGFVCLASLAVMYRRLPASWFVLVGLYVLPSLGFGIVGMGRYANSCFPVFVAIGALLAEVPRKVRAASLSASVVGLLTLGTAVAAGRVVP
jgi:hypothetical protein